MIERKAFFSLIRPLFGKLTVSQVQGIEAILDEWEARKLTDLRFLAYILATTFHETARTMQPIAEYGKGKGRPYGKIDPVTGQAYYGRGLVQITWNYNYKKLGALIGVDLYNHPDLAMCMGNSVKILFEGMIKGLFTGKKLSDYFNTSTMWVSARRIVNGLDKATLIAGYAKTFYQALNGAS